MQNVARVVESQKAALGVLGGGGLAGVATALELLPQWLGVVSSCLTITIALVITVLRVKSERLKRELMHIEVETGTAERDLMRTNAAKAQLELEELRKGQKDGA